MSDQPPIISVRGLVDRSAGALERVAAELRAPCREWGVFHVVDHGIPASLLDAFEAAMHTLFALPRAQKLSVERTRDNARGFYDRELTKNRPDWKEVFDYGAERDADDEDARHSDGTNRWPRACPEIREPLLAYQDANARLGLALLRALCASLGLEPDALTPLFDRHTSFVRLNHYPRCPSPAAPDAPLFPERGGFGVHHHTDAGALTTVFQDEVAGLQVLHRERWVTIDPLPGALAINLGDVLQVASNDRYLSPLHRVVVNPDRDRYSAPFFLNPGYHAIYAPLDGALAPGETALYRPISWSHFRDQRSAGDYADYGAEIQIADFRVDAAAEAR